MNPYRTWESALVARWHANPQLAHTGDTVGAHQGRVALIMMHLDPNCSKAALMAAVTHDTGEIRSGDVPAPAKRADAELKACVESIEWAERRQQGLPAYNLTVNEARLLRLCDWLDAYLWAGLRAPHVLLNRDWKEQRICIAELSAQLDVDGPVEMLLEGVPV